MSAAADRLAFILRELATKLESGTFADGHLKVKSPEGRSVGTIYFDTSEGSGFPDPDATEH